jgi:uncharacterized protein YkwD
MRELALASLLAPLLACVPVAAPQAAAACATRASTAAERNVLDEINRFRARNGRAALCSNARIDAAAEWLAGDMARKDYFSHTDSLGRNGGQRLRSFGYAWSSWGENIAAGYRTWHAAIVAWERSPEHRANLLSPRFREVGLGRAHAAGSRFKDYWTTDFGAQR